MAKTLFLRTFMLALAIVRAAEAPLQADKEWPNPTGFLKQRVGKVGPPVNV